MGLGDAKLILGIGWLLGLSVAVAALMLAFWLGAVVGVALLLLSRLKISLKTEIPFAPFLIASTLFVFLYGIDVFALSSFFHF